MAYPILIFLLILSLLALVKPYAITGPQGSVNQVTGQRPSRQDFSIFRNSGPAFDLYILSLEQFQRQNQSVLLSYYQVAGIHGRPYVSWDGVEGQYQGGYCTHGSILFPAWHRPYLALFEQLLWNNAQQIAQTYPTIQRAQYQAAASSFRIPYWDWSLNATMPDPVNDPLITVNTPNGSQSIINPLYNYTFHPQPSASEFPPDDQLSAYHSTVRYPSDTGESQPDLANLQLQANAQALHDLTYQLISDQPDYAPFSNTGYSDGSGGSYNSIENMHNAIHDLVGQNGHMAWIPYSAFDPIFWLHHTNVDRLFAVWQAIYPDSYTTSEGDAEGTYTNVPGSTEDINTPLTPFHSSNSTALYTSATARSTRPFGYTYPEVIDWNITATQLSSNVRTIVNKLYNPSASIATRSISLSPPHDNHTYPSYTNATTTPSHQYFINIEVDKSILLRPFTLLFFLGPPPANPSLWSHAPTLIGSHSVLYYSPATTTIANKTTTTPPNPNTHIIDEVNIPAPPPPTRKRITYGQVPLTHGLLRPSTRTLIPTFNVSASLHPTHILPLLQTHLTYRARDSAGNAVPADAFGGSLKMQVVEREVLREASGDRFPVCGGWRVLGDVVG